MGGTGAARGGSTLGGTGGGGGTLAAGARGAAAGGGGAPGAAAADAGVFGAIFPGPELPVDPDAGAPTAAGAAERGSPSRPTANTAPQTLHRARTPPSGILAGSTR
jgi:hypothetical protein